MIDKMKIKTSLRTKSLTQQYVVDQFAKIELSRLNFIKNNQKEMRAELYNGLKDAVTKNDGENIGKIGKKHLTFILY